MDPTSGATNHSATGIQPKEAEKKVPELPEEANWGIRSVKKSKARKIKGLRTKYRKIKPAGSRIRKARTIAAKATLRAAQTSAKAIKHSRVLSSAEFLKAAGNPPRPNKQMVHLCVMLDKYNKEVASPESQLAPAEKVLRTLEIRQATQDFADRQISDSMKFYRRSSQARKRLLATNAVSNQLEVLLPRLISQDKAKCSKEMCTFFCEDIKINRGDYFKQFYRQPKLLKTVISHMELADLTHLATTHGAKRTETHPAHVNLIASAAYTAISQLSSEEMKEQQERYNREYTKYPEEAHVSGDLPYDQSKKFCELMNIFFDRNAELTEMGQVAHQAYKDGHLTMNMLDELMEQKSTVVAMSIVDEGVAEQIAGRIDPDLVKSLHTTQLMSQITPDTDDPEYLLWLSKVNQFQALLEGGAPDSPQEYSDFVHTWDQLRFKAIPAYNASHKKDNLVELDTHMSRELAKVTPTMMSELEDAAGDPVAVGKLLAKTRWRKVPDDFSFPAAISKARKGDNEALADKLKLLATQDCLFRFFEARAEVELPGIPLRRKSFGSPPRNGNHR